MEQDGEDPGALAFGGFGQRPHVDRAQRGLDRAVHVGQAEADIAEHQQGVGAERGRGQRQDRRTAVELDVAEHQHDRRDHQRQQGDELDQSAQPRQAELHPVGGRHDDEDADDDRDERQHRRIEERVAEIAAGEHDAIGVEAVFAAPHAQREFEGRDQRREEIGDAEDHRRPGGELAASHLSHRSERARK